VNFTPHLTSRAFLKSTPNSSEFSLIRRISSKKSIHLNYLFIIQSCLSKDIKKNKIITIVVMRLTQYQVIRVKSMKTKRKSRKKKNKILTMKTLRRKIKL